MIINILQARPMTDHTSEGCHGSALNAQCLIGRNDRRSVGVPTLTRTCSQPPKGKRHHYFYSLPHVPLWSRYGRRAAIALRKTPPRWGQDFGESKINHSRQLARRRCRHHQQPGRRRRRRRRRRRPCRFRGRVSSRPTITLMVVAVEMVVAVVFPPLPPFTSSLRFNGLPRWTARCVLLPASSPAAPPLPPSPPSQPKLPSKSPPSQPPRPRQPRVGLERLPGQGRAPNWRRGPPKALRWGAGS